MSSPATANAPPRLGRYLLLGRVGRGGMGEVHRARAYAAAGVTKELCIKRIRRSRLADPGALARFVDEARLWMRLAHGNIVPVFDFGRIENDYYLAMEWVDGCDLRRLLEDAAAREAPLEDEVVLFVAGAIARALSYLHDAGAHDGRAVTHCDLKPSNVLVSRSGEVKLADFGVAVVGGGARAGGTRGYIPPSEARGERVGEAADLYALGRVLEELLERGEASALSSPERDAARALARRLVEDCREGPAPTAREIAEELESLSARARVRSGRSPRELLVARVALVPAERETPERADLETDASFATEGDDERAFLSHMEARSERTTSSAAAAPPPAAGARGRLGVAIAVVAVALVAALPWLRGDGRVPAARPDGREVGSPVAATGGAVAREPALAPSPVRAAEHVSAGASLGAVEPRSGSSAGAEGAPPPPHEVPPPAGPTATEARSSTGTSVGSAAGPRGESPRPRVPPPSAPDLAPPPEPAVEPAHLRINARPWAEVTVDGAPRGTTPITDLELAPGRHEVRLVHPTTGSEHTTIVELAPGERQDVIVDLRR